ncbi:serpin family protein [Patescibacteria group bacterium]|nr:serpin family protein [Patescibacteria group bacterium]
MTKQSRGFSAAIATIIVVIVIGVGVGLYLYFREENNTNTVIEVNYSEATPAMVEEVVGGINNFTFDLYAKLKSENGNLFFSPYSISACLAMAYEGAEGKTAEEIQEVFNFPEDDLTRKAGYASVYYGLNKQDKEYTLKTANALWAQQDFTFLDSYFNLIEEYYGGRSTNLDFKNDPANSSATINKWVEDQTNGKIKDLISKEAITYDTKLILTNAIYFYGEWLEQFKKDNTKQDDFRITPGNTVQVDMMSMSGEKFNYMENNQLQMLELPYQGEELSMLILLPKNDDIAGLEKSLTNKRFSGWKNDLTKEKEVNIYLPKFTFEKSFSLSQILKEMGMPTAFSTKLADFTQMSDESGGILYISDVVHKAFVEVNEEGTEAAAATGLIMLGVSESVSDPVVTFRADHPYIVIIQEKNTGNLLFMGRVSDPR